jgi:lipopolysaccharide/colanic/teichoic acid biosynthesis glycosyltransferase
LTKEEKFEIWELTRIFWVRYRYLANSFDITKSNTELSLINEIPVLEIKSTPLQWWNMILKRIFDIFSSLIWIIIFSPLLLIVYILIKFENFSAPAIFKNKRIWRDGKEFNLYKFRYLKWEYCTKDSYNVSDTEKENALNYEKNLIKNKSTRNWPLYKIKDDPRKTKFWAFIEKYSIDELPQFFNVLIWNMSLVWPRPHQPREVEKYLTHHKRLLTIKPWITWMAQVNWRDENNFDDEAKLDTFYIENWSLLLDLKIIAKTFSSVIKRK